jgi:hypothetical protein
VIFDRLLLRPSHVVRPEQALEHYRKFNADTRVHWAELLLYRNIEDPPEYPELLMDGCRFQNAEFDDTILPPNTPPLLEPAPQMEFDLCGVDLGSTS